MTRAEKITAACASINAGPVNPNSFDLMIRIHHRDTEYTEAHRENIYSMNLCASVVVKS